jgi:hypothetical protein
MSKLYIIKEKKSLFDQRVLITSNYAGYKVEEVELESGKGTKTEEFKKLNPRRNISFLIPKKHVQL